MPVPEPTVQVTRYQIGCLPEGHELSSHLSVTVEYRGRDKWAVVDHPYCLSVDGEWHYEIRPSERDDDWLAAHRFDLETALDLAKKAVPLMSVNGWTVERVLADIAAKEASDG